MFVDEEKLESSEGYFFSQLIKTLNKDGNIHKSDKWISNANIF